MQAGRRHPVPQGRQRSAPARKTGPQAEQPSASYLHRAAPLHRTMRQQPTVIRLPPSLCRAAARQAPSARALFPTSAPAAGRSAPRVPLGISHAAKGWGTRPLMSRSAERRTAGGPQARSRRDGSAAHPEGGRAHRAEHTLAISLPRWRLGPRIHPCSLLVPKQLRRTLSHVNDLDIPGLRCRLACAGIDLHPGNRHHPATDEQHYRVIQLEDRIR